VSFEPESILKWIKSSTWKVAFGVLALIFVSLLLSYFSQGGRLANASLGNAQRLIIPLQGDDAWIGTQVKTKTAEKEPEPAVTPHAAEEAPPPPITAEGEVADLTGAVPEAAPEEAVETVPETPAEVVVSDEMAAAEIAEETAASEGEEVPETAPAQAAEETRKIAADNPAGKALAAAPDKDLSEKAGEFLLPKISEDGVKPWKFYGKAFEDDKTPIIAIVVRGLGLGRITTENALGLDSSVTLSFSPYSKNTAMWGGHARNIGHEVLLDLPQESKDYPAVDPGPYALLNTLDAESNKQRLFWVMSRLPGFVGFLQTEHPALQSADMISAFTEIANRGLFFLEAPEDKTENLKKQQEQMGLITFAYNREIDEVLSEADIQKQLDLLVKDAKAHGVAIGVARPYPLTLDMINKWTAELASMGVKLAPVSAVIDREY